MFVPAAGKLYENGLATRNAIFNNLIGLRSPCNNATKMFSLKLSAFLTFAANENFCFYNGFDGVGFKLYALHGWCIYPWQHQRKDHPFKSP